MDGSSEFNHGAYIVSQGLRFPKDDQIVPANIRRALRANEYEQKETNAVLRTVRAGDRVVELGSGIGYLSTLVAVKAGR